MSGINVKTFSKEAFMALYTRNQCVNLGIQCQILRGMPQRIGSAKGDGGRASHQNFALRPLRLSAIGICHGRGGWPWQTATASVYRRWPSTTGRMLPRMADD